MLFLFFFAILAGTSSLVYTRNLVGILKQEERKKVELWAEATLLIITADSVENIGFPSLIIENNTTVPVILTDGNDRIIAAKNFDEIRISDPGYLQTELSKIIKRNSPIEIDLGNNYINRKIGRAHV